MNTTDHYNLTGAILELLTAAGRPEAEGKGPIRDYALQPMTADGSSRLFYRLSFRGAPLCIGILPADQSSGALAEARSVAAIGGHLFSQEVPVPEILAYDGQTGLVLLEDCGRVKLHELLQQRPGEDREPRHAELYRKLLHCLVRMQVRGADGFDPGWCHDTAVYDTSLMIERESHYFLRQFWQGLVAAEAPVGIEEEFKDIATKAGTGELHLFLHRDFQSRNIMVAGTTLKIIDFQGGRLGPPGYDLASLLIDPYAGLSFSFQEEMRSHYLDCLRLYVDFDENAFLTQYTYLQLQRNLQILGAFSFLYTQRRKVFFKQYILPALNHLRMMLDKRELRAYTCLRRMSVQAGGIFLP